LHSQHHASLQVLYSTGHPVAGHPFEIVVRTIFAKSAFKYNLKSDGGGRVELGALAGVQSIAALGYVMPVMSQFISSSCTSIIIPHVKDGTVFIPANLISRELVQLSAPVHNCISINEHHKNIACLPHAFRSVESNGVVMNVPPPGKCHIRKTPALKP